jgi:hypothetical protein
MAEGLGVGTLATDAAIGGDVGELDVTFTAGPAKSPTRGGWTWSTT